MVPRAGSGPWPSSHGAGPRRRRHSRSHLRGNDPAANGDLGRPAGQPVGGSAGHGGRRRGNRLDPPMAAGPDFEEQIAQARDPLAIHRREAAWVALGAIFAVAFGGAIGPEAGILALTAQLSSLISLRLAHSAATRRQLAEAGIAGALSGVYGSPAGGPIHAEPRDTVPRPLLFVAGLAGFAAFVVTAESLIEGAVGMMRLPRLTAES